jgi:hypothetical protein
MRACLPLSAIALLGCTSGGTVAETGGAPDGSVADVREGSSGEAGPPGDGGVPLDAGSVDGGAGVAFCDATYGSLRTAFDGCCASGDKLTDQFKFIDAIYAAITKDCESAVSGAIAHGRVAFDPTAAAACVSAFQQRIAAGNCWNQVDTNQPGPPVFGASACTGVVRGLQGSGAPCAVDFECRDGLTCVGWTGASDGTCRAPGAAGLPCEQAPDAGSALYIDWGLGNHPSCASGAYCVTPTCKAQGGSGAKCSEDQACQSPLTCHLGKCSSSGISADGGACDGKVDCAEGSYCAIPDGGAGTCTPRVPLGGDCTPSGDQCKGLCVVPDGGKTGVCAALCGSG